MTWVHQQKKNNKRKKNYHFSRSHMRLIGMCVCSAIVRNLIGLLLVRTTLQKFKNCIIIFPLVFLIGSEAKSRHFFFDPFVCWTKWCESNENKCYKVIQTSPISLKKIQLCKEVPHCRNGGHHTAVPCHAMTSHCFYISNTKTRKTLFKRNTHSM